MSLASDLIQTFFHETACPAQKDLEWLWREGVPLSGLTYPDPIRKGHVSLVGSALFELAASCDESVPAILLLARDVMGDPQDIVAWSPRRRFRRSLYGRAKMLGESELLQPRLAVGGCLRVSREPLDWLRANRRGVVLLDGVCSVPILRDAGPLMAEDEDHRREIDGLLASPLPTIHLSAQDRAA